LKVIVQLKGHLQWYDTENRQEVVFDENQLTPAKIIDQLNIPRNQIQFILVNDTRIIDDKLVLNENDVVKIIPVIEGG